MTHVLDPKLGDQVLIRKEVMMRLRNAYFGSLLLQNSSWDQVATVIALNQSFYGAPSSLPYVVMTSTGCTLNFARDEIIFPLSLYTDSICKCDIRILMNRGCQCGAKKD